jgi:hypothetical protein
MNVNTEMTFYEAFRIEESTMFTPNVLRQIRETYKLLILKYHPDKNPENTDEATRISAYINEAYDTLSDETMRRSYDVELAASRLPDIDNISLNSGSSENNRYAPGDDEDPEEEANGEAPLPNSNNSRKVGKKTKKKVNPDANRVMSFCFTLFLERFVDPATSEKRLTFPDASLDEFLIRLQRHFRDLPCINYAVYQLERTKKAQLLHIQGYIDLKTRLRIPRQVKKVIFGTTLDPLEVLTRSVHIEKRRGTHEEAIDYCKKEESREPVNAGPWEKGTPSRIHQGYRSDVQECVMQITEAVQNHQDPYGIVLYSGEHIPFVARSMTYIKEVISHQMQIAFRNFVRHPVDIVVIHGPTNVGKSYFINRLRESIQKSGNEMKMGIYTLDVEDGKTYFQNYNPFFHSILVIDECIENINPVSLLRLLDPMGYPVQLNVKFSSSWAGYYVVIILSNKHPSEWFAENSKFSDVQQRALMRRILHIENPTTPRDMIDWKIPLSPKNIDRLQLPSYIAEPFLTPPQVPEDYFRLEDDE